MFFRKKDETIKVEPLADRRAGFSAGARAPGYDEIKNAMEEEPTMQGAFMRQAAPVKYDAYQPSASKAVAEERTWHEEQQMNARSTSGDFAPLFVKVDKYREILRDIHELKLYNSGLKQLLDLIHDLETLRTDAYKVVRATSQRMEKTLVEVDSELLRPRGAIMSEISREDTEVRHVEGALSELQKQLADLKRELQAFK